MTGHLSTQLENIANRMEQFIDWSGRVVSWCVLLMVLLTFLVVVLRYVFDSGWIALQESVSYLHSLVFLLGAAYTLKHDAHVRVDIFYSRFSERSKAWVELLGHLFILIPVMLFIAWISWPYISDAWAVKESSRDAGGLPGVYLLKSLILLMSGLLIIQALVRVMRAALKLGGRNHG